MTANPEVAADQMTAHIATANPEMVNLVIAIGILGGVTGSLATATDQMTANTVTVNPETENSAAKNLVIVTANLRTVTGTSATVTDQVIANTVTANPEMVNLVTATANLVAEIATTDAPIPVGHAVTASGRAATKGQSVAATVTGNVIETIRHRRKQEKN